MGSEAAPLYVHVVAADGSGGQLQLAHSQQDVYTLQFFQSLAVPPGVRQKYDHNMALKCYRYMHEDRANPFDSNPVQCKSDGDWLVHCDHAAKGMDFWFDERQKWMWVWMIMVAQLSDEDQREVVQGPEGRSRGLLSCWCAPRPKIPTTTCVTIG